METRFDLEIDLKILVLEGVRAQNLSALKMPSLFRHKFCDVLGRRCLSSHQNTWQDLDTLRSH